MIITVIFLVGEALKRVSPTMLATARGLAEPICEIIIVLGGIIFMLSTVIRINVGHPLQAIIQGGFHVIGIVVGGVLRAIGWIFRNLWDIARSTWRRTWRAVRTTGVANCVLSFFAALIATLGVIVLIV